MTKSPTLSPVLPQSEQLSFAEIIRDSDAEGASQIITALAEMARKADYDRYHNDARGGY